MSMSKPLPPIEDSETPAAAPAVLLKPVPRPDPYYVDALKNVLDVFPASGTPVAAPVVVARNFSSPFLRQQVKPSTSLEPGPLKLSTSALDEPVGLPVAVWRGEAAGHGVAGIGSQGRAAQPPARCGLALAYLALPHDALDATRPAPALAALGQPRAQAAAALARRAGAGARVAGAAPVAGDARHLSVRGLTTESNH